MTRQNAKDIIYKIVNSGIISEELEEELSELSNAICGNDFEDCTGTEYCQGCEFQKPEN